MTSRGPVVVYENEMMRLQRSGGVPDDGVLSSLFTLYFIIARPLSLGEKVSYAPRVGTGD